MSVAPFPYAGEVCALLAPLGWAFAVIGYRSTDLPSSSINLFKNALALVLLSLTLVGFGIEPDPERSAADWGILAVSGVLGLVVADLLLLEGLRRIGAARVALVDTTYAPMMVVLSWVFLGERPGLGFAVGAVAVLVGVGGATLDLREAVFRGDRALGWGALMAFGAIVANGASIILIKPILEVSSLIEVTWFRMVVGLVGQALWVTLRGEWSEALVAFRPQPQWRSLVPAATLGTYVALVLWLGGFKWADASVAAVLNQLATVYILVLAWWVLREPLVPRQIVGGGLAVIGAIIIVATLNA